MVVFLHITQRNNAQGMCERPVTIARVQTYFLYDRGWKNQRNDA